MTTLSVRAQLTPEELLEAVGQLNTAELDEFMQRVQLMQAQRKAPSVSQEETDLLLRINRSRPPEFQRRYSELIRRRREETLTSDEYEELLRLTEQAEAFDVHRMECLVELAKLRRTSLTALMQELGITTSRHA
jgi:hypothetical protein